MSSSNTNSNSKNDILAKKRSIAASFQARLGNSSGPTSTANLSVSSVAVPQGLAQMALNHQNLQARGTKNLLVPSPRNVKGASKQVIASPNTVRSKKQAHGAHLTLEAARRCCDSCRVAYMAMTVMNEKQNPKPKPVSPSSGKSAFFSPSALQFEPSIDHHQGKSSKIKFRFQPWSENGAQLNQIIESTKKLNLGIYDILDNQIGLAIYRRTKKEIKCEEFELIINEAMNTLK